LRKVIKPPRLQKGDDIGIISPSQSPLLKKERRDNFKKGVRYLGNQGYKVIIAPNARKRYFYSAGTPQDRITDLHEMFLDKRVKYGPDLIYTFGAKIPRKVEKQILNCFTGKQGSILPVKNLKDDLGKKVIGSWKSWREGSTSGKLEGSNTIHMRLQQARLLGIFEKINFLESCVV